MPERKMPMTTKAAEISAKNICKKFGAFTALDDISLSIGSGEFLTLLGPSGSGKTTFLMVLAGFEAATQGRVTLDGRDVTHVPAEERAFGMVFQGYALFPHMTVAQNIAFPLKVQRRSAVEVRKRTDKMIEMVGLGGHGHKRPAALSGGQQQRVALARALACEPSVMLLDEPFSALDKNLRNQMQDEVRRLHKETGTTFVFVTHDQSEALALSNRIAIFDQGKLQQVAEPKDVYERPANRFVAEFLGDINILPLSNVKTTASTHVGQFEGALLHATKKTGMATETLAVRPEYMRLSSTEPKSGNAIAAHVEELTYKGAETRLDLRSKNGTPLRLAELTDELPDAIKTGQQYWVHWPKEKGFFI